MYISSCSTANIGIWNTPASKTADVGSNQRSTVTLTIQTANAAGMLSISGYFLMNVIIAVTMAFKNRFIVI
jgi:hypothetical protein